MLLSKSLICVYELLSESCPVVVYAGTVDFRCPTLNSSHDIDNEQENRVNDAKEESDSDNGNASGTVRRSTRRKAKAELGSPAPDRRTYGYQHRYNHHHSHHQHTHHHQHRRSDHAPYHYYATASLGETIPAVSPPTTTTTVHHQLKPPPPPPPPPSPSTIPQEQVDPPKAPRSAFICFRDSKRQEILKKHGISKGSDNTLKSYALKWRKLSPSERGHWDEQARNDKLRFVREKAAYKGTWAIPKRRAKKHPLAPKRPMSAFLSFSRGRRSQVKEENPDMSNTDVSQLLGELWRNATEEEKAPYREKELKERSAYKEVIKKWRAEQAKQEVVAHGTSRSSAQQQAKKTKKKTPPNLMEPPMIATAPAPSGMMTSLDHLYKDPILEDAPHGSASSSTNRPAFRASPPYGYTHQQHHPPYRYSPYRGSNYFHAEAYHPAATWPFEDILDQADETNNHNNDPLPVVPTRMPPPQTSHDDYPVTGAPATTGGGQYSYRSSYFSDYINMPPYSSRYNI